MSIFLGMLFLMNTFFLFSTLHPNAGARLRSEIALLPQSLLNPNASFGDALLHDQHLSSPVSTDTVSSSVHDSTDAGQSLEENDAVPAASRRYCVPTLHDGMDTGREVDLAAAY